MKQRISTKETLLAMLVLLHLGVAVAHAIAHVQAPVPLSRPALSFVITFALVGPVVGLVMQRTAYPRGGAWVIAATLAGAFWFGLVNHFLTFGPDHVTRVQEAWRALFETTAVFLGLPSFSDQGSRCGVPRGYPNRAPGPTADRSVEPRQKRARYV